MKMECKVRKPQKEDIHQIEELFALTIKDNFKEEGIIDPLGKDANKEIDALKKAIRNYFESNKAENFFLIASYGNEILGTIAYGEPNNLIYENLKIDYKNVPEIKSVYILPKYQNRGIGTLLLGEILVVLKENQVKYFCLDSGYKKAQNYWRKRLGKPSHILNEYWGKESHHMIWHCNVEKVLKSNFELEDK